MIRDASRIAASALFRFPANTTPESSPLESDEQQTQQSQLCIIQSLSRQ